MNDMVDVNVVKSRFLHHRLVRVQPSGPLVPVSQSGSRAGGFSAVVVLALSLALAACAGWKVSREEPPEPGPLDRVENALLRDSSGAMQTLSDGRDRAIVLFFLGMECPVSNGYAEEMSRLAERYGPHGVAFRGVYCESDVTVESARRHKEEHRLSFPVLLDPDQDLAEQAGVTLTPEAVVLDVDGLVLYRGRIDDRYSEKGRRKKAAHQHDLSDAIDSVLAGKAPAAAETKAFGCPLPRVRPAVESEDITYNEHVAPILNGRCVSCHRPGDVGPFSLLTFDDAAKRADFLRDITASRRMPPWKPRHGFGNFVDEARLTRKELAILAEWADSGAPEGPPAAPAVSPALAPEGWQLGQPDLVLQLPEPFTVGPAEDVHRAFALPIPLEHAQDIAAIEFRPGNRRLVHHARFYVDPTRDCRNRDLADPGPGFATIGGNDIPKPNLGAWNPGVSPRPSPPGIGHTLQPGSDLVVLLHYHGTGTAQTDRSSVGLYFARSPVVRSFSSIPLSTSKIDIPAGESRHRITQHATLPADVHAHSVLPHGHYLMREIKLWAELPDGTLRRLLWIDDWDLNWQGIYHLASPVALPKGTKLHLVATYDNSEGNPSNPNRPPRRVVFGPASTDEMLGCHVQILPDRPEDEPLIRKKWPYAL